MLRFISRRMFFALLTILIVSAVVFAIFSFLPFDPASLTCGKNCTPQIFEGHSWLLYKSDAADEL